MSQVNKIIRIKAGFGGLYADITIKIFRDKTKLSKLTFADKTNRKGFILYKICAKPLWPRKRPWISCKQRKIGKWPKVNLGLSYFNATFRARRCRWTGKKINTVISIWNFCFVYYWHKYKGKKISGILCFHVKTFTCKKCDKLNIQMIETEWNVFI